MNDNRPHWCTRCLTMSTRPRISFNSDGVCNACLWADEKVKLNWATRQEELESLLQKHRSHGKQFDCLVPVSGGKDGSYVAYQLKHKYGMNPLAVTITPALPLTLGEENLRSFVASGYNHISVNPAYEAMRELNKLGLDLMGFPYFGWLIAIQAGVIRVAQQFNINLIFYGEDGEVEYGGTSETSHSPIYDVNYMKKVYLEGGYDKVLSASSISEADKYFFTFPSDEELSASSISITHWSYFENWDPYRNYIVAKQHCGLKEADDTNAGTFTNFSQNDQALYALHTYLMYLKFGFGRANQDASIEVRRGAMTRDQAVNLVRLYDGHFPEEFLSEYLEYYKVDEIDFIDILDKYANKDLFEKVGNRWIPKFEVA